MTSWSGAASNNLGTVNVTGGRLTLNAGGSSSGAFNVSAGGVDLLINSDYSLTAGAGALDVRVVAAWWNRADG